MLELNLCTITPVNFLRQAKGSNAFHTHEKIKFREVIFQVQILSKVETWGWNWFGVHWENSQALKSENLDVSLLGSFRCPNKIEIIIPVLPTSVEDNDFRGVHQCSINQSLQLGVSFIKSTCAQSSSRRTAANKLAAWPVSRHAQQSVHVLKAAGKLPPAPRTSEKTVSGCYIWSTFTILWVGVLFHM